MKGIKRNKAAIALAIAAALSVGVVGCDSVGSKTDIEHVAAAKDFLDKDDIKSGVIELKSALQKNPKNAEARRLLGELNLEMGFGPAAEKELKRALELGVAKEAIMASLAEALATQGKYQEILDEIEAPANLDPVEQAKIISYRGDAWLYKKKPEKAKAEYERALQVDAQSGAAKLGLAKLAVANKKSAEADQLISEALQSSPKDSNIWLFQAELQRAKGELDKAEESYGQAIKLNKRNLMARYQRALLRIGKKDFETAEKDIDVLKKEAPKSFQRHYAEGMLAFFEKKFSEAEAALDESLKINGNFTQAVFYRGIVHLAQNHQVQAENDLSRVQKAVPNAIKPRQLLAQVLIKKKDYKEAKALLDPVIKFIPNDPVTLNLLGNIEFALGNTDQGMEYLQKLAELKPDDAGVHARLGLGLLQSGEQAKGIKQLEQASELAPGFQQGDAFVVMAHLKAKEYGKAEKVLERIKNKYPDSPFAGNLVGMFFLAKDDQAQAKKAFEAVLVKFSGNPTAANALADMALKVGDYTAVRELYTEILAQNPKHLKTKLRLAALEVLENNTKEMEVQLKEAIEGYPEALVPRLVLSRYYTRYGQPGRAQTLLEEVKAQYGNNLQLLSALFDAQLADKNVTRALETAKKLVEMVPNSADVQFMLASAYEASADAKNMRDSLSKSLELNPQHVRARMAMVKLLTIEGGRGEAKGKLSGLIQEFPEQVEVLNLQGWFALQNSKPQEATIAYQKVLKKQPSTKAAVNFARAELAAGKRKEGIATLNKWLEEYPGDVGAHYVLSTIYGMLEKEKANITELEKVLELRPDHIFALNDLAWRLRKTEPAKALSYVEGAYAKAPKFVPVMDTLAMVLLENGQAQRALTLLERAVELSPKAPSLKYHLAIALEKNGKKAEAIQTLRSLLFEQKAFSERREAEALLKQWKG